MIGIFTARNSSCGKVMFLHLSVILFTGVCIPARNGAGVCVPQHAMGQGVCLAGGCDREDDVCDGGCDQEV